MHHVNLNEVEHYYLLVRFYKSYTVLIKMKVAVCKNPQTISSERPSDDIAGVAYILLHIKVCNT